MRHRRPHRFFLQRLPATLGLGLLAVAALTLATGALFEFWLRPGMGWEGRSFMAEATTGAVSLADLDGDGRRERLIAPRFNTSLPPSIKVNRAQADLALGNKQYFVAGRLALRAPRAATDAAGTLWLAALTASRDTTTIYLSLLRRDPGGEDFQPVWQGPLFTPREHDHNWRNAPELSSFLFVPTTRGERALFSINSTFLGWRGVVEADLGPNPPEFRLFPCGSSQNRHAGLLGRDARGRPLLYSEGLAAGNGNALGGIDDFWGGLLVFDPDSGFRKGPDLGRAHKSFGVEVAPDGRHLLLHTAMRFAPQPGDTFNLALMDGWTGRILWSRVWPGLINAEWATDAESDGTLPDFLVLSAGRVSRCRPDPLVETHVVALPAQGMKVQLDQGWVSFRAARGELWLISADGRSRGRIRVDTSDFELLDPQGPGMGRLVVHVVHDGFVDSYAMVAIPAWARLGRQPATWWALALGVLGLFAVLGFRIHHQEQLLRGIVEEDSQPVAILDTRGEVRFANRACLALLAEEATARRLGVLAVELPPGESRSLELGGRWLRWFRRPVVQGSIRGSLLLGFDETAEREAQEGRKFRSMAGMITHELKTPMTPIRLGLDQLRREVEQVAQGGSPGIERVMTRMRGELESMNELIRQFMRLAGEGRREGELDLREVVEVALRRCGLGHLPQVRLDLSLPARPVLAKGDGESLALAIAGLLTNALEAMERRGVLAVSLVPLRGAEGGEGWRLIIQDEGPGIPPEIRDRIWEPGFSTKPDGYGYGLFFARKVLAQNGASLRLDPAAGGGTLATVEWGGATG